MNPFGISVFTMLMLGVASESVAQVLAQRAFDVVFEGDDPGEVFTFDLAFDQLVPSLVRFDGSFKNLAAGETGVRYDLLWLRPDGSREQIGIDFTRLPASGELPVEFEQPIGFTPDSVLFHVEGGGGADHFRFVGDFVVEQVPEPDAFALVGMGGTLVALGGRLRRNKNISQRR